MAGVAKGTVYLYFDDKEEIIGTIAIMARNLLLDYFKKYTQDEKDSIEKIKGIFWADYYFSKEQKRYHQLITFYEQNSGLNETGELAKKGHEISIYIKGIIDEAIERKAIRQDLNSASLSFMFWGMTGGIMQLVETREQQLSNNLNTTAKNFFEFFVNTTVEGLIP